MDTEATIRDLLEDAVRETGADLRQSAAEVAAYANARALHLSAIASEPGFAQAIRAERNNVAMRAGLSAADDAAAADQRILGIIQGALAVAAAALA